MKRDKKTTFGTYAGMLEKRKAWMSEKKKFVPLRVDEFIKNEYTGM